MSWFFHVSQGANQQEQQQQFVDMMMPATATASLSSSYCSRIRGPSSTAQNWAGRSSPSLEDLPPAPQSAAVPPSLESLSCTSQSAGLGGGPEPISYVTLQEQRCVLSWFLGWTTTQRERFLQDLLGKAVPGKVCTLLDSLSTLQVKDRPPNIFECQLRLWTQWFESWSEEERNRFLHMLEERDPVFVAHFYRNVAGTAGRD